MHDFCIAHSVVLAQSLHHMNDPAYKRPCHLLNCTKNSTGTTVLYHRTLPLYATTALYSALYNYLTDPVSRGCFINTFVIHSFILSSHPFPPNLQDTVYPKPQELGSWIFERMFTHHHVSHVMCHMSGVMCQVSYVRCHMSGVSVRCQMLFIFYLFFSSKKL